MKGPCSKKELLHIVHEDNFDVLLISSSISVIQLKKELLQSGHPELATVGISFFLLLDLLEVIYKDDCSEEKGYPWERYSLQTPIECRICLLLTLSVLVGILKGRLEAVCMKKKLKSILMQMKKYPWEDPTLKEIAELKGKLHESQKEVHNTNSNTNFSRLIYLNLKRNS